MRTLNYLPRNLTNGYRPIVPQRWHFIITLNLSDRRHFDSDHAAPAQLYRGNLSHSHWPGWRIPPVRTLIAINSTPQSPSLGGSPASVWLSAFRHYARGLE